ncbi:MAG: ABC transporter permease [Actinomycetota bacterium]
MTEAQAVPGILALGLLFTLVANEFDFSGGAVISGASVAFALLTGQHGVNWAVAGMIVLVGALVIGLINGMLVGILHYNSFVATLAVGGIVAGVTVANSHGATLNEGIPRTVIRLGDRFHGIPLLDVSLLGVFVVVAFILRATVWGRHHDAIGKGREAAVLAGVRVRRHIVVAFMASAFLAGLAGLVLVAYLGSAPPNVGQSYTLSAFAAAFLGSTMLRPGFFNAEGTLVAIMLIAVGVNGLSLAGADSAIGQIFTGVVLLASVGLTRLEQLSRR